MSSRGAGGLPSVCVVVLAKEPVPGRCKTRLSPFYSPVQAAALAEAALLDTLDTVQALLTAERGWKLLLSLDGQPRDWLPPGIEWVPQPAGTHDERIAGALQQAATQRDPADSIVLVGMDTPQVTSGHLRAARAALAAREAVLGPAADGGWWLLGLRAGLATRADELVVGVPTSTATTGERQRRRLEAAGLRVGRLSLLRDVDTARDVELVQAELDRTGRVSRFARLATRIDQERVA